MNSQNSSDTDDALDRQLDRRLDLAFPEVAAPAHLRRQVLLQIQNQSHQAIWLLDWFLDAAHWWRPAAAGVATLIIGYVLGIASPQMDERAEFEAVQLLTLIEEYEDYDESL